MVPNLGRNPTSVAAASIFMACQASSDWKKPLKILQKQRVLEKLQFKKLTFQFFLKSISYFLKKIDLALWNYWEISNFAFILA